MTEPSNVELIERFYRAFAVGDGDAMASCYAGDATFTDPVFELRGREPGAMWRMFTTSGTAVDVELLEHEATGDRGSAHWTASYTFTQTGRPVVNDIHSAFVFRDGRIVEQRDAFDFYAWAKQAFGPLGVAVGWTPMLKAAVRRKARASLDAFIAKSG